MKHFFGIALLLLSIGLTTSFAQQKVIFDTDMATDCDDAGALAMLHALQDKGECELLGVMVNDPDKDASGAVDVINTYYGRGNIPIGVVDETGQSESRDRFTGTLVKEFPFDLNWRRAPNAVKLYRELLANARDQSIVIVSVGFLGNLGRLLDSDPDQYSSLTGEELVAKKVKELVCMGGRYPSGFEHNFHKKYRTEAKRVVDGWTAPVTYSGYEIGVDIMTGPRLWSETPESNPVRRAYDLYLNWTDRKQNPRNSWDQTAVLYAVRGAAGRWGLNKRGSNTYDKGNNAWVTSPDPRGRLEQAYLTKKASNAQLEKEIDDLMVAPPGGGGSAPQPPKASFTVAVNGLSISVDASQSSDDQQIVKYDWDWGDGATGAGKTAQHTFGLLGFYTVQLTVTDNEGLTGTFSQQVFVSSGGGDADNTPDPLVNLALLPSARLSGSVSSGRGSLREILYDPSKNDYVVATEYNEYGVNFRENIGRPNADQGFYWQASWSTSKKVNYITFGGTYPNQPQSNTRWRISYLFGGNWITLDEGKGGWINSGIYEWGGETQAPVTMVALRVQVFSDGANDLVSIHLRGRGGRSTRVDDRNTTPKACLVQFIGDPDTGGEPPVGKRVAYWKFNESQGTQVKEEIANLNGTLKGNTSSARVAGVDGNALQFGPADRWVDVPADEAFSLNEITLSCWIKLDQAVGGWRTIIEHDRSGSNWYGLFMRDGSAGLHFRWSRRQTLNGVQQLEANRWYHVAATFDATTKTAKLYIDGELDATRTGGGGMTKRLSALRIGANLAGKEVFPGSVDEVQLFSKALSAREIKALSETFTSPGDPGSPGSMTVSVAASADDAEQNLATGMMDVSSSDLDFANTGLCAMRFSLDIPKGATITSARLLLVSKDNTSGANTLLIKGQVANNASPFSNSSRNISSRNTTGASVSWEPGLWTDGQTYTSPGLETIVQEVVGRRRWSAGNYLGLIVSAATGNKRLARSYDYGGAGDAPKLEVTYTTTASNARVGEKEELSMEVNVSHNTVGNTLTVHFQAGDDPVRHRKLVVYSLQGHKVISRDIAGDQKDITLDMSRLNKGMYIVNIHTGKAIKQFKFIK